MVLVNCVCIQEEIIKNIEFLEYKGEKIFKHVETEGVKIIIKLSPSSVEL